MKIVMKYHGKNKLYGAILGDIAGKRYEYKNQSEIPSIDKIDIYY